MTLVDETFGVGDIIIFVVSWGMFWEFGVRMGRTGDHGMPLSDTFWNVGG